MNEAIEEWTTGDMTASMAAAAALLKTLPVDGWRASLERQIVEDARRAAADHDSGQVHEYASDTHRRARRVALREAAMHAQEFIAAMTEAMEHNRAVARAVDLEASVRREEAAVDHPAVVRELRPRRTGSVLHDTFPGARVIPIDRVAAMSQDGAPYEPA